MCKDTLLTDHAISTVCEVSAHLGLVLGGVVLLAIHRSLEVARRHLLVLVLVGMGRVVAGHAILHLSLVGRSLGVLINLLVLVQLRLGV